MFLLKLTVQLSIQICSSLENEEKFFWEPVQVITWLVVTLNTIDGTIKATDKRIKKIKRWPC